MKERDIGNRIRVREETELKDVGRKALSSSRSRNHGVSVSSTWSIHSRERKDAAEDV